MNLIRSIQMSENSIRDLQQKVEDGELTAEIVADTIEAIEGEIDIKCDAIAEIVNANDNDIVALEKEVKRLNCLIDNLKSSNQYLKNGLLEYLKQQGSTKLKTKFHRFSVCKNGGKLPLEITRDVPEEFCKCTFSVDTEAIRNALDKGKTLDFAYYKKRGEHLKIN